MTKNLPARVITQARVDTALDDEPIVWAKPEFGDAPQAPAQASREAWLNAFVAAARPVFISHDHTLPAKIRVSVGFPSSGWRSSTIGECWSEAASADGHFEIFINPKIDDAARVAGILTHELCHAAVGIPAGHGPKFGKIARALGLEGPLTATTEGDAWRAWAKPIVDALGPLPHAALGANLRGSPGRGDGKGGRAGQPGDGEGDPVTTAPRTQGTRLIKALCPHCGFTSRVTRKWIDVFGGQMLCSNPTHHDRVFMDLGEAWPPHYTPKGGRLNDDTTRDF